MDKELETEERLSMITQSIGFALWQLQELEKSSANYFVLLTLAQKGMGLAKGNILIEKAQANTFGKTIFKLTKAGLLSPELKIRFDNLLIDRNWLVHKSRTDYPSAVYEDLSMRKILSRLEIIANEALALLKEIGIRTESFVKKHGVSPKYIDDMAEKLLKQWHESNTL